MDRPPLKIEARDKVNGMTRNEFIAALEQMNVSTVFAQASANLLQQALRSFENG